MRLQIPDDLPPLRLRQMRERRHTAAQRSIPQHPKQRSRRTLPDVITIETSRSDMELLDAFDNFNYPNEIGPGVYDIHSPNIPSEEHIVNLMKKAAERIPAERLWVNPDCGLKTRQWAEVIPALKNMVAAAQTLRQSV